jgi:hypothetical protein
VSVQLDEPDARRPKRTEHDRQDESRDVDREERAPTRPRRRREAVDEGGGDGDRKRHSQVVLERTPAGGERRTIGDHERVLRARSGAARERRSAGDDGRKEEPREERGQDDEDRCRDEEPVEGTCEPPFREDEDDVVGEGEDHRVEEDADTVSDRARRPLKEDPRVAGRKCEQEEPGAVAGPPHQPVQPDPDGAQDEVGDQEAVRERLLEVVARRDERASTRCQQQSNGREDDDGSPAWAYDPELRRARGRSRREGRDHRGSDLSGRIGALSSAARASVSTVTPWIVPVNENGGA